MDTLEIVYKVKSATVEQILAHLTACSSDFHPPLVERVDIKGYSQKIFEKSITFEAWRGITLIGLLAVYINNDFGDFAFVTNVSVLKNYMGRGIASELLRTCIQYAVKDSIREIRLNVNKEDVQALGLYGKFGFESDGIDNEFLKMTMDLSSYS